MTPKEKAKELVKQYSEGKDEHGYDLCLLDSCAKQCALIAVQDRLNDYLLYQIKRPNYWQEVKQEIEKL